MKTGNGERPCGRSDDPGRGLLLGAALRLRGPEHHRAHPPPHPGDAEGAPHAPSRGNLLPPQEDGWLLPHLLQAKS